MGRLSLDAFRTLIALGWIDGELHPSEADAIRAIARHQGLDSAELGELDEAMAAPTRLGDPGQLDKVERLLLFGMARWITRVDGRVTEQEGDAMHALSLALGIGGRGRSTIERLVDELIAEADPGAVLDVEQLESRVRGIFG